MKNLLILTLIIMSDGLLGQSIVHPADNDGLYGPKDDDADRRLIDPARSLAPAIDRARPDSDNPLLVSFSDKANSHGVLSLTPKP